MSEKNMLTREGYERLLAEHEQLSKHERPRVVQGIATAAAEGDRSENAEYIYGKKRLRELDRRLSYLSTLLKDPLIVDPKTLAGDRVVFGATVVICDDDGKEIEYTIVGEGESDAKSARISYRAPVAKALLGKRVGDVVLIERPAGELEVEITGLLFAGRAWDA